MRDVSDYMKAVIKSHLNGDASRFDELWELVPGFGERLRSFNGNSEWMHWSPKTFDGWYCVKTTSGYDVYFQERGVIDARRSFPSDRQAVSFLREIDILP
jgi:hypothetical protein